MNTSHNKSPLPQFLAESRKKYYCCKSCGISETNRVDWCDLGCGRDYNEIFEVKKADKLLTAAFLLALTLVEEGLPKVKNCELCGNPLSHHGHYQENGIYFCPPHRNKWLQPPENGTAKQFPIIDIAGSDKDDGFNEALSEVKQIITNLRGGK